MIRLLQLLTFPLLIHMRHQAHRNRPRRLSSAVLTARSWPHVRPHPWYIREHGEHRGDAWNFIGGLVAQHCGRSLHTFCKAIECAG